MKRLHTGDHTMIRKTISIDEELFRQLQEEGLTGRFKTFSELVSAALRQSLKQMRQERYRRQISEMADDPLVQEEIARIQEDFIYADRETF